MPNGGVSLADFLLHMVELAREKCVRRRTLRSTRLIDEYTSDIPLPQRRVAIAKCGARTRCMTRGSALSGVGVKPINGSAAGWCRRRPAAKWRAFRFDGLLTFARYDRGPVGIRFARSGAVLPITSTASLPRTILSATYGPAILHNGL